MVTVQEAQSEPETPEQEPEAAEPVPADPALVAQLQEGFAWRYPAAKLAAVPAKVSVTSIVHKAEQTTLERPAFLSKDGLTAAEMGTALHAFLEHADFASLAAAKAAGTLEEAILAERQRHGCLITFFPDLRHIIFQTFFSHAHQFIGKGSGTEMAMFSASVELAVKHT